MSADNGIYIFSSDTGFPSITEYRVAHLQAVDNLTFNDETGSEEGWNHDNTIRNAREIFKDIPVHTDREEAWRAALEMSKEYDLLEYGIQYLQHCPRIFNVNE